LLIGAAMFVLWQLSYSVFIVLISAVATAYFLYANPAVETQAFFLKGGLLLIATAIFMVVLIQTRYSLTVREIKARLALKFSNDEIQSQAEEIRMINDSLETLVKKRTQELERKTKALEEYAFINAHKLRGPVATLLGLINLLNKADMNSEARHIVDHMDDSARRLDNIVASITRAIEKGESRS
jgi:signal transduction histidine kinase